MPRLRAALDRIASEDWRFRVTADEETGQIIISGTDELHLDAIVGRIKVELDAGISIGAPRIAYRETISHAVAHDYTHKRHVERLGQFAHIKFRIEPKQRGGGFEFASMVIDGHIPAAYIPAVRAGVTSVMRAGPTFGFPIVDVKFILTDGAYHDIDSSAFAFEAAGRAGFKEAIERAGPKLLEPIMAVEVIVPPENAADVIGDLNARRGQIVRAEGRGLSYAVNALVPLGNMFGYVGSLRATTRGRGRHVMAFSHYAEVPDPVPDGDGPYGGAMAMRA